MDSMEREANVGGSAVGVKTEEEARLETLKSVLATSFGEPAPVRDYRREPTTAVREKLEVELSQAERAHAVAAARLRSLYTD